jgi:hypothetical protein
MSRAAPTTRTRKVIHFISVVMIFVGFSGFVGQAIVSSGALGQMSRIAWPVGRTTDAIQLPDGRYAIPLEHIARIQIYSPDLHFQYGWQVSTGSGAFTLLSAPNGRLQIYTARGRHHYVYQPDGKLVSARIYDYKTETYPRHDPAAVSLSIPSPWWAFPFRGPFYSWAFGAGGIALIIVTTTREERAARRRRASVRASRPSGPIAAFLQTVLSWIAAAVWAIFGVVWFVATLSAFVHLIASGNILGAIIVVPFFLIGCGLLFISITIVRTALAGFYEFVKRPRG